MQLLDLERGLPVPLPGLNRADSQPISVAVDQQGERLVVVRQRDDRTELVLHRRSLMASEAVLKALMLRAQPGRTQGKGVLLEVALSDAAAYLALPRHWGLTTPKGAVGGAHAGYQIYPCLDGRVAVAALEPHFAKRLLTTAGITQVGPITPHTPQAHQAVAHFFAGQTRRQLERLATAQDIPLHTLPR